MARFDRIALLFALCAVGAEEITPGSAATGSSAGAAEMAPIAVWSAGDGRLGEADARDGAVVTAGVAIAAGAAPVRLELVGYAGSDVILAAGSRASFATEPGTRADRLRLVVTLAHGRLAVDLDGEGPWEDIEVRGAAVAARSDGGEFAVERSDAGDYCALARGQVVVRTEVGEERLAVQLQARQGVAAGTAGLSAIDQLDRRPQITDPRPLAEQGTAGGGDDDGGWDRDQAALATRDVPAEGITAVAGWPVALPAVAFQAKPASPSPSASGTPTGPPATAPDAVVAPPPAELPVVAARTDAPLAPARPTPAGPNGPEPRSRPLFEAVAAASRAREGGGLALVTP